MSMLVYLYHCLQGTFGQGTGPIWHDDLECTSNEASLSECPGLHGKFVFIYEPVHDVLVLLVL